MPVSEEIQALAAKWLREDKDESTRAEMQQLLDTQDEDELGRRLRKRIAFGTAGLRSSMKAGFAHMNSLIVLEASQGLAQYVIDQGVRAPSVVIGHDARYNSEKFARLAAGEFLSKGFQVLWFDRLVHTPMVPFSVGHYKASVGVMVTASHNPKNDNGYKVYWSNGSQIIPPHDAGIAACIDRVEQISNWDVDAVEKSQCVRNIADDAIPAYIASLSTLAPRISDVAEDSSFVYTPMHGVGLPFMQQAVLNLGISQTSMKVVKLQAQPDPEFPTVPFPNPEEKGALDLAMAEANAHGVNIAVASDPDADRFSFAERLPSGAWHQFTGNQIGILLASYIWSIQPASTHRSSCAMLATTVSSRMLASMAKSEGFHFRETLTGFKWLGNVGQTIPETTVYAFEEAIGFMFPIVVWDKDGIAAATVFLSAWQCWKREGLTPWMKLQQLYQKYGYFEDANTYLISPSPATTEAVFGAIRRLNNGHRPDTLGKRKIGRWRDLTVGYDTASPDGKPDLPVDPSAQMITCELDGVVFTARGSGTEPKIKVYIEGKADSSEKAKALAHEVLQDLLREWFKPEEYGLRLAGS